MFKNISEQSLAKFCGVYSGLVFGIYWIPLRALESAGFEGMWASTVFNGVSTLVIVPLVIYHWHRFLHRRWRFHIICFGVGLGYALYASAFVYTEVVSAIVLFYLMPIWGFLLARWFIGDPITPVRWLSMLIAFAGLWTILGKGSAIPLPQNAGDWMSLSSGLIWAGLALMILTDKNAKPLDYAAGFVGWGFITCFVSAMIATHFGYSQAPDWSALEGELIWLVPFAVIIIVPAAVATIYTPTKLNPGIVGLLFMTEISVGTITAAMWAGEPFGTRQVIGIVLITIAGILETAWMYRSPKKVASIY
jgi:drug/metabolite transporter (DMT)-like permease